MYLASREQAMFDGLPLRLSDGPDDRDPVSAFDRTQRIHIETA